MDVEKEAEKFHDKYKDQTGADTGEKIADDLANMKFSSEKEKRAFFQALDHSDSTKDKVQYNFKDTGTDGVRDTLVVQTQHDAWKYVPGNQLEFTETEVPLATVESFKKDKDKPQERQGQQTGDKWYDSTGRALEGNY